MPLTDATDNVGGATVAKNLQAAAVNASPIRGAFSNLPSALVGGFDAALTGQTALYLFKGNHYVRLTDEDKPKRRATQIYDLIRLTTATAARLNREIFTGGVKRLLNLRTQEADETPGFSTTASSPTLIRVNPAQVNLDTLPTSSQLDFTGANGIYLWEIFFHAPFLIAEMLSTAQRFEEAQQWYEHIFDPTEPTDIWKFLPFLTEDVERIVIEVRDRLARLEQARVDVSGLRATLDDAGLLDRLLGMDAAFQGERAAHRRGAGRT